MAKYNAYTEGISLVHDFADKVKGRTFLLTGPSKGGTGAETVISLAHGAPAITILLGRSLNKIQPTIDSIKEINETIKVKFVKVDLASLSSTRTAAETILADDEIVHIDVVVDDNAAVMACTYQKTEDGFELQLAANYLGHFVLTNTIIPKILAAGSYGEFAAYGSSKSAMILYAVALNQRLASRGVHAYGLHPGSIMQDHLEALGPAAMEIMDDGSWRVMGMSIAKFRATCPTKTLQQGCATTLRAALDPRLVEEDGVYLEDSNLVTDIRLIKEWASDSELADKYWKLSEEVVGQKFEF
ncbi:WW domain-containing oxidoreductase [Seiridium cupressi]